MKKFLSIKIIALFSCTVTTAQQAATNNGNLQIHSGANLSFFGNFSNESSGAFINNGSTYVRGMLTNNEAAMSEGSGTLYLNGNSAQSVAGTQPMRTSHLNTDNSNGITLNNNLRITGAHTFTNGIITTSSTPNYLVYEAGSNHSGSADSRHVNGWVKKIGNTAFTFPTGNGTYLRNIAITALSASSEFDARYSGTTTNTGNLASPLVHINPAEYWTLNKISGGNAQATLNWDHSKVAFPNYVLADIRSAQYTSGNWTNTDGAATGTVTTTGSITSSLLSSFGAMAIGSVSFVVPLRFIGISASRNQEYTSVQWKTVNEERVAVHDVQRSLSGTNFITIGQVSAMNIQETQTYQFDDHEDVTGTIYYRIKSIDLDGKASYSKIVSVRIGASETLKLIQNPARETIVLSTTNKQATKYQYQLISTEGKLAQQGTITYTGLGIISLSIKPTITTGTYILIVKDSANTYTLKVVVE